MSDDSQQRRRCRPAPRPFPRLLPQGRGASADRSAFLQAAQVVGQSSRRRVALRRVLGQALADDRLQVAGHENVIPPQGGWDNIGRGDGHQHVQIVLALERQPGRQQFVQDDSEAEQIAAAVKDVGTASLLWTHVTRRAQDVPVLGQPLADNHVGGQSEAEVHDLCAARGADDHDVGELEVAVGVDVAMDLCQPLGDLAGDAYRLLPWQQASRQGTILLQRPPFHPLHHQVGTGEAGRLLHDLVDLHDMVETIHSGGGPRLVDEPPDRRDEGRVPDAGP
jgi:hypothetical protein